MSDHKQMKKNIVDYGIISCYDYIRSFDKNNWTDLSLNKLEAIVNPESNYVLVGNSANDNPPIILFHENLEDIYNEINERMIKTTDISGYDAERHRVFGYYEGDGILRIGNMGIEPFVIRFETPTIEDLLARKNYLKYLEELKSNKRHRAVQSLLISLGLSLNYDVKVAKNDSNELGDKANLTIDDLNIPNLKNRKSRKAIDLIDVIWLDPEIEKIVAAFEVEFSNRYDSVYSKLGELNTHCFHYASTINSIIVGNSKSFMNVCELSGKETIKPFFTNNNLSYLPLENLAEALTIKDRIGFRKHISVQRDTFFHKILIPINKKRVFLH